MPRLILLRFRLVGGRLYCVPARRVRTRGRPCSDNEARCCKCHTPGDARAPTRLYSLPWSILHGLGKVGSLRAGPDLGRGLARARISPFSFSTWMSMRSSRCIHSPGLRRIHKGARAEREYLFADRWDRQQLLS